MNLNIVGSDSKTVEISDELFGKDYNETLVHQAVVAYLAAGRQGSVKQKTRSEVSGGGAKPFRQKGTGRARAGTTRGPIWRTGGVTFAARPRNYEQKLNKKMYRAALRSIYSELIRSERLHIVDEFDVDTPKTKNLKAKLGSYDLNNVLVITSEVGENLALASRNLPTVDVSDVAGVNPVKLIAFDNVLITVPALKKIEEALA